MLFSPLWKHLLQGSPRISPGTCMRDISIENFIIEGMLDKAMLRPKEQLWKPPCIGLNVQTILCWHRSLSTIGVKNLDVHNFHGVRIAEADQSHYSKGLWGSPVFPLFFFLSPLTSMNNLFCFLCTWSVAWRWCETVITGKACGGLLRKLLQSTWNEAKGSF